MKFTCEKQLLQNAIAIASRAASAKSSIEELEGLLLEAGSFLKITGYDLKEGIYTRIEADVTEPGSVVLNAKLFGEMIRRMEDGIVSVDTDGNMNTNVKCGKTEFSFMGLDAEKYPELPSVDGLHAYEMPQAELKSMIDQCLFAVSTNDSRPVYTGAKLEIENGKLNMIAVDGFRMAVRKEKISGDYENNSFIVPAAALSDIDRICASDGEDIIKISVGGNHVSFVVGDTVVVTRRLEGDFLNYKKAIPTSFKYTIKVKRTEFLRAVDRVSLIVDEKNRNPVRVSFKDGIIYCLCNTPKGKAEDVCLCDGNGEDLEIGFNDKYLMDALKAAPSDELLVCLNTGSTPCVLLPADENDESFTYMILPIRLRG